VEMPFAESTPKLTYNTSKIYHKTSVNRRDLVARVFNWIITYNLVFL
jgi:hypothetical protein